MEAAARLAGLAAKEVGETRQAPGRKGMLEVLRLLGCCMVFGCFNGFGAFRVLSLGV